MGVRGFLVTQWCRFFRSLAGARVFGFVIDLSRSVHHKSPDDLLSRLAIELPHNFRNPALQLFGFGCARSLLRFH